MGGNGSRLSFLGKIGTQRVRDIGPGSKLLPLLPSGASEFKETGLKVNYEKEGSTACLGAWSHKSLGTW